MDQIKDGASRPRSTPEDKQQRDKADELLRNLGADQGIIETVKRGIEGAHVQSVVDKLRTFAQENPAVVLGALTALIAGGAVASRVVAKKTAKRRGSVATKKTAKPSATAAKKSAKRPAAKTKTTGSSSKRTLIEPHPGDKRFVRRDAKGRIKESVDVGRSLAADRRSKSKTRSKPGQGDKGDR